LDIDKLLNDLVPIEVIGNKEIFIKSSYTPNEGGYPYCYVLARFEGQFVTWQMFDGRQGGLSFYFHDGHYCGDDLILAEKDFRKRVKANYEKYGII